MEQVWLLFSLISLITGFGLLTALILLQRMLPPLGVPVTFIIGALIFMGAASLSGVYLNIRMVPLSIFPYRLLNAGAWGFSLFAACHYLHKSRTLRLCTSKRTAPIAGVITAAAAFLAAHPPEGGLIEGLPKQVPILVILFIELLIGVSAIGVGITALKQSRTTAIRPWKKVFRGLGIALLILIPANLLEFIVSLVVRLSGGYMSDGFIFAFGYGIANIALLVSILEAFRSRPGPRATDSSGSTGSRIKPALSLPLQTAKLFGLSKREQEIVEKLLEGKNDRQIAGELYISPRTVDTHLRNIFRKCGVNSRLQLSRLISDYSHYSDYGNFRNSPAD